MGERIQVRAAAKVNLHLGVGAPREDGYHPLTTVFGAVGIYDDLTLTRPRPDDAARLRMHLPPWMDHGAAPPEADNIALRAADLIAPDAGDLGFELLKEIPIAGGMAGGSADAAAALLALDRLLDLRTPDADLLGMAARLGSDVPFALLGGTALGRGRGEQLTPVEDAGTWWWVVVAQREGLSTPAVYRRFDELFPHAPTEPAEPTALLDALASGEPDRLAPTLHNDLQAPALDLRPELADLIERGERLGALRGLVSGSGPTVVFSCAGSTEARELGEALRRDDQGTVLVANGPVAGAHVIL